MDLTPEQIAMLAGVVVSVVIWLAKWALPRYDLAPTIYKVGPVVVGTVLSVGFAAHWQGGMQLVWQMLLGIVAAFVGYRLVGQPVLQSIRDDDWQKEDAAVRRETEEANDEPDTDNGV